MFKEGDKLKRFKKAALNNFWRITDVQVSFHDTEPFLRITLACFKSDEDFYMGAPALALQEFMWTGEDGDLSQWEKDAYKILKREHEEFAPLEEEYFTVPSMQMCNSGCGNLLRHCACPVGEICLDCGAPLRGGCDCPMLGPDDV